MTDTETRDTEFKRRCGEAVLAAVERAVADYSELHSITITETDVGKIQQMVYDELVATLADDDMVDPIEVVLTESETDYAVPGVIYRI